MFFKKKKNVLDYHVDSLMNAFTGEPHQPPFSFTYKGISSDKFLCNCYLVRTKTEIDSNRTKWTLQYNEPPPGCLQVICEAVEYHDYSAVEWTVYFKNVGSVDTSVLKNIQGLDAFFQRSHGDEFTLNSIRGDWCSALSYQPIQFRLHFWYAKKFSPLPYTGKSSNGPNGFPYYNLQMPGGGVIIAIGWPGQWASSFKRDLFHGLTIKAGQELTNLYLKPGEIIRTPLIVMLFWEGNDIVQAQNRWRRWYIDHNIPRVNGQPPSTIAQIQVRGNDVNYVESFLQAGIKPDICWRDAGWYKNSNSPNTGDDAWLNTGTWEPNPSAYPNGFKPFSDWIHERGMKFLLWFEPERVGDSTNSWLGLNHPEWLLHPGSVGLILNEGNPNALDWLINYFDDFIKKEGIDWYREDMNGDGPCFSWRNHDFFNRKGITENFYVQGHLAFWDELRRRNPLLRIDSCASGGRRNDLETMRRAVPLLRSDFQFPDQMEGVVEGNQGHTYGLSFWLPFQGSGCYLYDKYSFRSFYLSSFGMGVLNAENAAVQKIAYDECRQIAPSLLFGDYYPLTPYSLELDQWIAWQFHRPELGVGVVQAFKRKNNPDCSMTFKLHGLELDATYVLTNFDGGNSIKTGDELANVGLTIKISDTPGSAIITYNKRSNRRLEGQVLK